MPSAMPPPYDNRHKRPCDEPTDPSSSSSSGPVQPLDFASYNYYGLFTSSSPYNTILSASHPVSAFSSSSSSDSEGDQPLNDCKSPGDHHNTYGEDVFESLEVDCEGQSIFHFELGPPYMFLGDFTGDLAAPGMGFGELDNALTGLCIDSNCNYPFDNNNYAVTTEPSTTINANQAHFSPSHSIANLPHLLTPSSSTHIASLSPTCHHCTLPVPIQPITTFDISTISFTNPLQRSIFILTSPPLTTPSPFSPNVGIYLYLSSTDMYFHSHPGPLPQELPGFVSENRVGRVRNASDPEIWLPTGAGGGSQDWLWVFRDVARNMRMPPRETSGWRALFTEDEWVASVVGLARQHGIVVDGE